MNATPLEDRAKTIRAKNAWLEIPVTNLGDNHPHFLRAPHLDVECFAEISRFVFFSKNGSRRLGRGAAKEGTHAQ
jgi:hypothetical protein